MLVVCHHCGEEIERRTGEVNRARKRGLAIYCDRHCSGLGRRKHKSLKQRRAEKSDYDRQYRRTNRDRLRASKAAYHKATYDPARARIARKRRAPAHAEYCRRPAYKAYKRRYDAERRASQYGDFADAYKLFLEMKRETRKRISWYESAIQNGRFTKAKERKRGRGVAKEKGGLGHASAHS